MRLTLIEVYKRTENQFTFLGISQCGLYVVGA